MLWTQALIETDQPIEIAEPKEGLAPQPQKMWNNSAKKGAVSLATNKATSPEIVRINPLITNQPIRRSRRTLKPAKLILMIKLLMKRIMEVLKIMLGSIKVKLLLKKKRLLLSIRLERFKLVWRLVLKWIFKHDNPVGLGAPSQSRIEDCIC